MRQLNTSEILMVSGGFGPEALNGIGEALVILFGTGVVVSFCLGIACIYGYQYFTS